MNDNPFVGVLFHWLGGFASGSFYVPYRCVKKWAWEVYWLVGGILFLGFGSMDPGAVDDVKSQPYPRTPERLHLVVDLLLRRIVAKQGTALRYTTFKVVCHLECQP